MVNLGHLVVRRNRSIRAMAISRRDKRLQASTCLFFPSLTKLLMQLTSTRVASNATCGVLTRWIMASI